MPTLSVIRTIAALILCSHSASAQDVPDLLPARQDRVERSVREARNAWFNVRQPFSMLEPRDGFTPFTLVDHSAQAELPHESVDTVVIGEVVSAQPFLSADKKGLYREYGIRVMETLKSLSAGATLPGDAITVLHQGGTARTADGKILNHHIRNDIAPAPGNTYLWFLRYDTALSGYQYCKLWLVEDGVLKPLYPDDIARGSHSEFAGKSVTEAVRFIRAAIQ